jgi:hypothetical protein
MSRIGSFRTFALVQDVVAGLLEPSSKHFTDLRIFGNQDHVTHYVLQW